MMDLWQLVLDTSRANFQAWAPLLLNAVEGGLILWFFVYVFKEGSRRHRWTLVSAGLVAFGALWYLWVDPRWVGIALVALGGVWLLRGVLRKGARAGGRSMGKAVRTLRSRNE